MYHQLVAGPVVRYADVAREIATADDRRRHGFSEGADAGLFTGWRKRCSSPTPLAPSADKFLLALASGLSVGGAPGSARRCSTLADLLTTSPATPTWPSAWGGCSASTIQENFNYPYVARSATEFWRRWHISLSQLLPGLRLHPARRQPEAPGVLCNLLAVWLLTGLWHGASWNFILWGLYYGAFIALERLFLGDLLDRMPAVFGHLYLLLLATTGWVIFYFTDLGKLGGYLSVMFGLSGARGWDSNVQITLLNNIFWVALAAFFCMPAVKWLKRAVSERLDRGEIRRPAARRRPRSAFSCSSSAPRSLSGRATTPSFTTAF